MPKKHTGQLVILALLFITNLWVSIAKASDQPTKPPTATQPEVVKRDYQVRPVTLIKYSSPRPLPEFWDELARCETGSNWKNGGKWAGGLGIYVKTWNGYGGREFAKTPDKATKEQQIIVANRIAVEGWLTHEYMTTADRLAGKRFFRPASGFDGWGALPCAGGTPALISHVPSTVVAQKFSWNQKGVVVGDLQAILGVKQTFVYDAKTWAAHQRYIMKYELPRTNAPRPHLKKPSKVPASQLKRCPQFEHMAYEAGFPKNQLDVVSYLMWRESRCVPTAVNQKDPHGGSRGLLQVNGSWTKKLKEWGVISKESDLLVPKTNLRAAFYMWTYALERNRYSYGWEPWSIW